ncbi:MAG: type II secretion system F family protein [Planctomycetota bacterium]|nr:type II secretion system F family protein [Planctomycetota bacterium]
MPEFSYTARDLAGEKVSGQISAASQREALNLLSGRSLFPLSVTAGSVSTSDLARKRVKGQVMAMTYSQLSSLLKSGVPLLRSLRIIQEQTSDKTLKLILGEIHMKVEDGRALADAMTGYPRAFSEMAVNMARAGSEGGFLEEALDRVARFTEQQEDLKSETIGALAYPLFLGTIGSLIVAALIIFFVPRFGEMFDSLRARGELPVLTDWLLAFSNLLRQWWMVIVFFLAIMFVFLRYQLQTESGRRFGDALKLRIPLAGAIFQNLAVARFCRVLGTLLRNGVPILKSLEISREAAGNRVLSEAIDQASENITAGESLAKPLAASGHFPRTVVEMISVAEESNTLDEILVDIADGLETRTSRHLTLLVRLLEPIMLLVLAGAVLFVVIALLLPVIKMSSTI